MTKSVAGLFTQLTIRGVTLKNRIGISPMCTYSSNDGFFNNWHLAHLGARAIGGAGLVFCEATAVEPEGRISPYCTGMWKDEHIDHAKQITDFIKSMGAVPAIQLAHAGRKASSNKPWFGGDHLSNDEKGWTTKAPTAEAFDPKKLWKVPHELSVEEILDIQNKYVQATIRSLKAGFEIIEVHAAHGYLFHEFYSPLTNKRTDQYGGSFENRTRFVVETVSKVRKVLTNETPLFVRLSCTDWKEGGWTPEDTVQLCQLLKKVGADVIDCSSGFVIPNHRDIPFGPSFQLPFAEKVKKEVQIMTATVGGITKANQANEIIESGRADIVLVARESLRNPNLPFNFAIELGVPIQGTLPTPHLSGINLYNFKS